MPVMVQTPAAADDPGRSGRRLIACTAAAQAPDFGEKWSDSKMRAAVETDDETIANGAGAVLLILKSLRPP